MTVVLDASAIPAFLQDEEGADLVEVQLAADARCGGANWPRWHRRSEALAATGRLRVRCWLATACPLRLSLSQMRSGRRRGGGAVKDSHLVIGCVCRWHIG